MDEEGGGGSRKESIQAWPLFLLRGLALRIRSNVADVVSVLVRTEYPRGVLAFWETPMTRRSYAGKRIAARLRGIKEWDEHLRLVPRERHRVAKPAGAAIIAGKRHGFFHQHRLHFLAEQVCTCSWFTKGRPTTTGPCFFGWLATATTWRLFPAPDQSSLSYRPPRTLQHPDGRAAYGRAPRPATPALPTHFKSARASLQTVYVIDAGGAAAATTNLTGRLFDRASV